jgi:hypothetical protein
VHETRRLKVEALCLQVGGLCLQEGAPVPLAGQHQEEVAGLPVLLRVVHLLAGADLRVVALSLLPGALHLVGAGHQVLALLLLSGALHLVGDGHQVVALSLLVEERLRVGMQMICPVVHVVPLLVQKDHSAAYPQCVGLGLQEVVRALRQELLLQVEEGRQATLDPPRLYLYFEQVGAVPWQGGQCQAVRVL